MIRVAAYCRVSTDKDDQANSFESQQRYFRECIERSPDWELQEIYADDSVIFGSSQKPLVLQGFSGLIHFFRSNIITRKVVNYGQHYFGCQFQRWLRKNYQCLKSQCSVM